MRLMAVMAHPDDAEIWCGGTLIIHAEQGDEVRICLLTYGEDSARGVEAQEGARRMGCEIGFLGLVDTAVRDSEDGVETLKAAVNAFQPDIIITHWFDDPHPDHEAAFHLVRRVIYRAYFRDKIQLPPSVFCCDTYNSQGIRAPFQPDRFVDVSRVWEKKAAASQAHQSQPISFFMNMMDRQCLEHGKTAGVHRAEGFLSFLVPPGRGEVLGGDYSAGKIGGLRNQP